MISFFKQLFCKHSYQIKRWHWTHGANGNEPAHLEVEHVCIKCGKKIYSYPERNSTGEEFILKLPELQW